MALTRASWDAYAQAYLVGKADQGIKQTLVQTTCGAGRIACASGMHDESQKSEPVEEE